MGRWTARGPAAGGYRRRQGPRESVFMFECQQHLESRRPSADNEGMGGATPLTSATFNSS